MTTNYQMWFTHNGEKDKIQIPVLPDKFDVTCGSKNSSVSIVGLGEITIMQGRPAFQFSFSSFLPCKGFQDISVTAAPLDIIEKLKQWKDSGKPIHIILTKCKINIYCTIENLKYYEKGGDVGTIYYSLTLKEYRTVGINNVKVNPSTGTASVTMSAQRVNNRTTPKTYTVKPGDCLWNIAKMFLGNGSRYKEIYELNKDVIGTSNPNLIFAGQVLKIPS